MARKIDSTTLAEANAQGNYPIELVSIEVGGGTSTNIPGANEIQSATYTGTRSNVVANNPASNEFARISIPSSSSATTPAQMVTINTTSRFEFDFSGLTYPFTLEAVTNSSMFFSSSGTPSNTINAATGFLGGINSPDYEDIDQTFNNANEFVTFLTGLTFLSDQSAFSITNVVSVGNGILAFDHITDEAVRVAGINNTLAMSLGSIHVGDAVAAVTDANSISNIPIRIITGLPTFSYDPDTSDTVYTTSVPNTLIEGGQNASQILTTMGNTIAALETDITFDGNAVSSNMALTGTIDQINTNFSVRPTSGYIYNGVTYFSGSFFLNDIVPSTGVVTIGGIDYNYDSFTSADGFELTDTSGISIGQDFSVDIPINYIDIDLGTTTNIGQMLTMTGINLFTLTETHGVPGSGSTGTATTYTLNHYNGSEITQFTSSVTSNTESDLDSVKTNILNGINNNTQSPINFTATDDEDNSKIIATASTQNTVNGTFSLSVNNHGQTTDAGDINFNGSSNFTGANTNFIIDTQGALPVISSSNNLYLNTGYKPVTYESNIYTPGSGVVGLTVVEQTKDVKTNSISITLNGIDNTIIAQLEATGVRPIGGKVTIYQAFFNADTGTIVGQVYEKWKGIIYSFSTTEENQQQNNIKINIDCKNVLTAILETKSGRFTSDTSFRQINATDRSMEFVPSIINFNPNFGSEE